ncbi:MAG TPA: acyl-CoA dehydrogenase family protein [Gemmataceae bacterium]|nr:acyl-CoA dehydrogenase family protein [Gemmataceae bacterium]
MVSSADSLPLDEALPLLETHAGAADAEAVWPAASWDALRRSGVLGWIIPREYGGAGLDPLDLLEGYQRLAGACLTTCFLLSQRDSACRRLRDGGNEMLCRLLLPALASGERFATVGLAQLTTSRQHVRPVLVAQLDDGGVRLNGVMPWVTGAPHADHFLTGVMLEDGRQMLLVVPRDTPGLSVGPPMELMALQGSLTAEVRCEEVRLDRQWVLAGPAERVLAGGRGAGGLETSGLALGLAKSAIAYLDKEANKRTEWRARTTACAESWDILQGQLRQLVREGADAQAASNLRAKVNALVLSTTQFALAAGKGSGFLRTHPAQRWARQALFFLVWSCPAPALDATLACMALPSEE